MRPEAPTAARNHGIGLDVSCGWRWKDLSPCTTEGTFLRLTLVSSLGELRGRGVDYKSDV